MNRHVDTQRSTAYGVSVILIVKLKAAVYQGRIDDPRRGGAKFEF